MQRSVTPSLEEDGPELKACPLLGASADVASSGHSSPEASVSPSVKGG